MDLDGAVVGALDRPGEVIRRPAIEAALDDLPRRFPGPDELVASPRMREIVLPARRLAREGCLLGARLPEDVAQPKDPRTDGVRRGNFPGAGNFPRTGRDRVRSELQPVARGPSSAQTLDPNTVDDHGMVLVRTHFCRTRKPPFRPLLKQSLSTGAGRFVDR